ncbi:MAG TPA: hypothetical protein VH083_04150 [Myxococcales bacterium]|jgi:hypothetical protein|nr:hypothetical protein [Myxococcales bacterium]
MAHVNLQLIRSKADLIGTLNPAAWDAVHPHIPFSFSNAHVELFVADVVKHVAAGLADKTLARTTFDLSKKMGAAATSQLSASWEPGDDICPPWPWPFPHFTGGGPQPDPWVELNSAMQIELAHVLIHLSGLTSSAELNKDLKGIATQIARGAAGALTDEFEKCGTKPRPPIPSPRR